MFLPTVFLVFVFFWAYSSASALENECFVIFSPLVLGSVRRIHDAYIFLL